MGWAERLADIWPHVAVGLTLFVSIVTSGYVVLYKRDSRSAVIWVAFIWLAPIIGSISYLAFGVNRIRLRARALRDAVSAARSWATMAASSSAARASSSEVRVAGRVVWRASRAR